MHRPNVWLFAFASIGLAVAQNVPESAPQSRTTNSAQSILAQAPNAAITSFGTATFQATGDGSHNAVVGAVRQTGTAGKTFTTGVTGYGSMENSGNQAFGIFGRCDLGIHQQHALPGTCANELNAFNFNGAPSAVLPPDLAFGTMQNNSISLQLVAYGDYDSSIALNLAGGGGARQFYVGEYINPLNSIYSGIVVDATSSSSAKYGAILKASTGNIPLHLQTVGKPTARNAVAEYTDGNGVNQFTLDQAGDLTIGGVLSTRSIAGLTIPLTFAQGGTSSTSASGARSALGAAQSGNNSDITSLTNIHSIALATGGYIKLAAYTVASLPTCNSERKNALMAVTDAMTPVYNGSLTGGGSINIPVFCNGAAWTAH
jgi:hypothetical protein